MSTNPFNTKPNTNTQAPAPAPRVGGNPFAAINDAPEYAPQLPGGCQVKARVEKFRIKPNAPGSPLAVFLDLEILEVYAGGSAVVKPGAHLSHGIKGFHTASAAKAYAQLKSCMRTSLLNICSPEDLEAQEARDADFWPNLPARLEDGSEISIVGCELYIETKGRVSKEGREFVIATYAVVEPS